MEGVGARFGRSSARYVPATVFTGPVRKWKKKWVHAQPSNPNHHAPANRAVDGISTASCLLFYKWTPITYINNIGNADSNASNIEGAAATEEPLKKKFKYIPIEMLEEPKNESSEQIEDDANLMEIDTSTLEATSDSNGRDDNPDISDVTIDESQALENNAVEQHDLNERTLDLSLGLKVNEEENETDTKADQVKDNYVEHEAGHKPEEDL